MTFQKLSLSLVAGAVALVTFVGCDANVRVGVGRGYDRTWYGDPYCRNNWDYGCRYGERDSGRIGIIFERRHPGWGRGWHNVETVAASEATRPTSWEKEFNLNERAVRKIKSAFETAINGDSGKLAALGMDSNDIAKLQNFSMPSNGSISKAAHKLNVKSQDLRDFVEVFTIRMKTGLASNE